jgi:pimeloyl-ACP methyl ester carboxylesterase
MKRFIGIWIVGLLVAILAACSPGEIKPHSGLSDNMQPLPSSPTSTPQIETEKALPALLPDPQVPGEFISAACRFVLPENIHQGEQVNCGYLTVPEQRTDPDTHLIRLAVAVFHPPGGATQPDPLIYLSGGPGASVLKAIRYQFDLLSKPAFDTGRDLILFDQRGVGLSLPALDCPELDQLSLELLDRQVQGRPVTEAQTNELLLESIATCRTNLSQTADLSAYNTAASAADVEDMRQALGYESVNLWGGSYGTRLALEVMRSYPQGLRSVVLDAVYPPDVDLYSSAPDNFQRALDRLFAACTANMVCNQAYPDLETEFYTLVTQLNAEPVLREIQNPLTGQRYQAWMSGDNLLGMVFQLLYDSKLRYLLPGILHAASQGDYTTLDQVRGALIAQMKLSSRGMMFSVQCHEEIPFSSLQELQNAINRHPQLAGMYQGPVLGKLTYSVCSTWPSGQASPSANQPVTSDTPTLVLSGEFDPITPPEWGRRVARNLQNAFFYEYPGVGHGAGILAGCPNQMMADFLNDPQNGPDESCMLEMGH